MPQHRISQVVGIQVLCAPDSSIMLSWILTQKVFGDYILPHARPQTSIGLTEVPLREIHAANRPQSCELVAPSFCKPPKISSTHFKLFWTWPLRIGLGVDHFAARLAACSLDFTGWFWCTQGFFCGRQLHCTFLLGSSGFRERFHATKPKHETSHLAWKKFSLLVSSVSALWAFHRTQPFGCVSWMLFHRPPGGGLCIPYSKSVCCNPLGTTYLMTWDGRLAMHQCKIATH